MNILARLWAKLCILQRKLLCQEEERTHPQLKGHRPEPVCTEYSLGSHWGALSSHLAHPHTVCNLHFLQASAQWCLFQEDFPASLLFQVRARFSDPVCQITSLDNWSQAGRLWLTLIHTMDTRFSNERRTSSLQPQVQRWAGHRRCRV